MINQTNDLSNRRYDVDKIRVIALGLLIFFHIFISYQPFAEKIGFIPYEKSLSDYWWIGEMLSIWRIPILFLISGMGLRFAMERRSLNEVIQDRTYRLVLPLAFGALCICPIFYVYGAMSKGMEARYFPHESYLWFVKYIFLYVCLFFPLFIYIKENPHSKVMRIWRWSFKNPLWLLLSLCPLIMEAQLIKMDPDYFSAFAMVDYHRFWYGALCFILGFMFVSAQEDFWDGLAKVYLYTLAIALCLYLFRIFEPDSRNNLLNPIESFMWMISVLGLGQRFLNHSSKAFAYLSKAVFPIYILHMSVQQMVAYYLFPYGLSVWVTLGLHLVFTYGICFIMHEGIRRISPFHPFMGMTLSKDSWVIYQKGLRFLSYLMGGVLVIFYLWETLESIRLRHWNLI